MFPGPLFNSLKKRFILSIGIFFLTFASAYAQLQSIGSPLVQNFTKSQYHSGNKNWAAAKDSKGIMYFGNSEGLLVYDGSYWQLYPTKNHLIIRSVACDAGNKVYTGAYGEFGYWSYNDKGRFNYHSLIHLVEHKYKPQDEIWKIYIDGDRILFQTFSAIYIYQGGRITVIKSKHDPYLFLLRANNRFFVQVHRQGLFELKGNELELIKGSAFLGASHVLSVLPYKTNSFLIGTSNQGIFVYDGDKISPWNIKANALLKLSLLNNGTRIDGQFYAYGTILNGIIILNEQGEIVQKINKSSGLQNNTVLSLFTDDQQIWAGLDNGIDRIELNSSLSFYFDKAGKFGTIYASAVFGGNIYLGTNQGIFYSKWHGESNSDFLSLNFELIKNSQGQVWNLSPIDGQLICGHNDATYRIENNVLVKISDVKGGWTIKQSVYNPNYLIQGTYNGLAIYKKDNKGFWTFDHMVSGFSHPSRYVEQDAKGQIWVSHAYKGVSKLVLDGDLKKVLSIKNYDESSGLPSAYNINVFSVDNRILFSSNSGFYVYDDFTDRFSRYNDLNVKLGDFAASNRIIKARNNQYWFINHGKIALCTINPGALQIDSGKFTMLKDHMVQLYENVTRVKDDVYLISIDDGFAVYDASNTSKFQASYPPVLIRRVTNIKDKLKVISETGNVDGRVDIPYADDDIRIQYTLPYYRQCQIKYQYYLEGYSSQWSEWTKETAKDFTNLNAGDYAFKVRAKIDEKTTLSPSVFVFRILRPWYANGWAFIVYCALLFAFLMGLRKLYQLKLIKQHHSLETRLQQEAKEALQQEAIANEQKIILLKNDQLSADLTSKKRQLASTAMNVVQKNENLQKIKDSIVRFKKAGGFSAQESAELRKIIKLIDSGMDEDKDWRLFENSFSEAHIDFLKKLKADHPALLPSDLKLCAYLKMNMSSKEIATLLNITVRGVEIRRYRLRKKLNLEHDKNLVEFLMNV
ncbi:MAG TPA: triple tyrosine motif-containing protein [Mucilaginibacter sp.]|jgi:ligand-binding sensor domain-containing protein/DNA-binding CsgD family transcriptional regulator|nr:triple tyrosine motif-containing protein [Mucilaginibacter sp.]